MLIDLQAGIIAHDTAPYRSSDVVEASAKLAAGFRAKSLPVVIVTVGWAADMADAPRQPLAAKIAVPADQDAFVAVAPELNCVPSDILVRKRQWGAFYGTDLDLQLRRRGVHTIVLAGIATNIGVESTARAAWEHGYSLVFAEDATASFATACTILRLRKSFQGSVSFQIPTRSSRRSVDDSRAVETLPAFGRSVGPLPDGWLGAAVVMLHDSPRSSRLHIATMQELAVQFMVYALDTPGYGNSSPLPIIDPTIRDFADALGETLAALDLQNAPLYATHTSAKIALEYVADCTDGPAILLLDGLSIPVDPADEAFMKAYMRPFTLDAAGAYLAAEWTRLRDMLRWFPWFDARVETRMPNEPPSDDWLALYALDLLSAGPHYSDAYAAAMRYDTLPALRRIKTPTIVAARADDVLFSSLDRLPHDRSAHVACKRLPAHHTRWLGWLTDTLTEVCGATTGTTTCSARSDAVEGPVYVDLPNGQIARPSERRAWSQAAVDNGNADDAARAPLAGGAVG